MRKLHFIYKTNDPNQLACVFKTIDTPNPRSPDLRFGELWIAKPFNEYHLFGDDVPDIRTTNKFFDGIIAKKGVAVPVFGRVDWRDGDLVSDGEKRPITASTVFRRLSTNPGSLEMGYSRCGAMTVTAARIKKLFSTKRVSDEQRSRVLELLRVEVAMYDAWMNDEVFEYMIVDPGTGEVIEADGGYYGDLAENGLYRATGIDPATPEVVVPPYPFRVAERLESMLDVERSSIWHAAYDGGPVQPDAAVLPGSGEGQAAGGEGDGAVNVVPDEDDETSPLAPLFAGAEMSVLDEQFRGSKIPEVADGPRPFPE